MGFSGGPTFSTDKLSTVSGQEKRLANRAIAIHAYHFAYSNQTRATIDSAKAFFYDRRGDFKAFLFKDWTDYAATASGIGVGDDSTTDFQLVKTYTAGSNPYIRTIQYVKSGTLVVYIDGVPKALTSDYTVSATGLVTFVTPPANGELITADFEFYVPVRFDGDEFSAVMSFPNAIDAISVEQLSIVEVLP